MSFPTSNIVTAWFFSPWVESREGGRGCGQQVRGHVIGCGQDAIHTHGRKVPHHKEGSEGGIK